MEYAIEILTLCKRIIVESQSTWIRDFGYDSPEYKETVTRIQSIEKAISILEAN